jgi:hypothetical protein
VSYQLTDIGRGGGGGGQCVVGESKSVDLRVEGVHYTL